MQFKIKASIWAFAICTSAIIAALSLSASNIFTEPEKTQTQIQGQTNPNNQNQNNHTTPNPTKNTYNPHIPNQTGDLEPNNITPEPSLSNSQPSNSPDVGLTLEFAPQMVVVPEPPFGVVMLGVVAAVLLVTLYKKRSLNE